jgi:phosphoribosylformimino-5-aminoimidazole carboxamide ribotide isomerase
MKPFQKNSNFQIIPAIDILNGKCVRLKQGDYNQAKEYSSDPVAMAKFFENQGARYLHVVDLDGAKLGNLTNFDIINKIISDTSLKVEISGGIRSLEDFSKYIDVNPWQIIIGSMAVKNIAEFEKIINKYGVDKITLGIDFRDGLVYTDGWQKSYDLVSFLNSIQNLGIKRFIITDISKDGMLSGSSMDSIAKYIPIDHNKIIVSGGVSNMTDVEKIYNNQYLGVIIGKAIYENIINLEKLISYYS